MGGYSNTSEPIVFERDCNAVMVPQGETVNLPAGQNGYITQALGGSFTVFVDGNLFRIDGKDADAIGKEPPVPIELAADASEEEVEKLVWQQLRTCFDPEIPINIVDLGLIYNCEIKEEGRRVEIKMTLTAPGCGMGPILAQDVQQRIESLPEVEHAEIEVVFDPPWDQNMMSEAARLELGMF
jgi:probable FeS assembly SUF system protein SufT